MKVFLSWSGDRSKQVATILASWLETIIQSVEPLISTGYEKGSRWNEELSEQLQATNFGICCLTSDNLDSPWLHFEAGALAKHTDGRVCTFLLDIEPEAVKAPLAQFQATRFDQDDMFNLLVTINSRIQHHGEKAPSDSHLRSLFNKFWPDIEPQLQEIKKNVRGKKPRVEAPDERALLVEAVTTLRRIERDLEFASFAAKIGNPFLFPDTPPGEGGLLSFSQILTPSEDEGDASPSLKQEEAARRKRREEIKTKILLDSLRRARRKQAEGDPPGGSES